MKNKIFLYSLTSLAVTASSLAHATQDVYVPEFEGGLTASIGTFYVTPTSDFQSFISFEVPGTSPQLFTVQNVDPGYSLGIDASLGYVFEDTANSIDLFFRNISTTDTGSASGATFADPDDADPIREGDFYGDLGYELNSFDLMFSQFMDIGQVMQARFMAGLAYVELEQNQNVSFDGTVDSGQGPVATTGYIVSSSQFKGFGPRVGIDTRYQFGENLEGLGIVAGGSMAYFLGDMDYSLVEDGINEDDDALTDDPGNHAVLNLRANVGLDYVYFFDNDEKSTLGLEVGYMIDYYDDGVEYGMIEGAEHPAIYGSPTETSAVSFAGPYVQLKGAF